MGTKTITVTEDAYEALKSMKSPNESFSEAIRRIARRKPLSSFYGILDKKSGKRLEKTLMETRKMRNKLHRRRLEKELK